MLSELEKGGSVIVAPPSRDWFEPGVPSDHELMQADLILGYPLTLAQYERPEDDLEAIRAETAVLVLTQSCDIPKASQEVLLLGVVTPYAEAIVDYPDLERSDTVLALREGNSIAFSLIPPSIASDWAIVSFRDAHTVPKIAVQNFVAREGSVRLRLRSPYREHVAQSYARFLMRVGLPITYHSFDAYAKQVRRERRA